METQLLRHFATFLLIFPQGITLLVSAVAAVLNDVHISIQLLILLPQGNLICKLSTGDGHVIYLHNPEG